MTPINSKVNILKIKVTGHVTGNSFQNNILRTLANDHGHWHSDNFGRSLRSKVKFTGASMMIKIVMQFLCWTERCLLIMRSTGQTSRSHVLVT